MRKTYGFKSLYASKIYQLHRRDVRVSYERENTKGFVSQE